MRSMCLGGNLIIPCRYIDIGANLTDDMYRGIYREKVASSSWRIPHNDDCYDVRVPNDEFRSSCMYKIPFAHQVKHTEDLNNVLQRAFKVGKNIINSSLS